MQQSIKILKALSDETRINILLLVSSEKLCAKAIARNLQISEAAVSQQIKILKEVNLLVGFKRGYHIVYELNEQALNEGKKFIESIEEMSKNNQGFSEQIKKNEGSIQININNKQCMVTCKSKKCCIRNLKEE